MPENRPKVWTWLDRVLIRIVDRPWLLSMLGWGSLAVGFVAAVFWWWSAAVPLPAPGMYWEKSPENDPFLMAIRHGADLNGIAAILTGVSVALAAVASWVHSRQLWPPAFYNRWWARHHSS